jgi:hypothetical protein
VPYCKFFVPHCLSIKTNGACVESYYIPNDDACLLVKTDSADIDMVRRTAFHVLFD